MNNDNVGFYAKSESLFSFVASSKVVDDKYFMPYKLRDKRSS